MMRTRLTQGVLGFTALALLVGSFKVMGSKPAPPPPTTVTVTRGVVLASVNATGNVTVEDQLAVDFPVGGKVTAIFVQEGQRVVAGQPLATIDDHDARDALNKAQADYQSAQEKVNQLLEPANAGQQQLNNANIGNAQAGLAKAIDAVGRAQDTLKTGSASRENDVRNAQANLANAQASAAQHAKDLQLAIDQVNQRLGEHTAQLNVHQAKFQFDSQQADSSQAAELATEQRISAERATIAQIQDEMNRRGCSGGGASSASSGSNSSSSNSSNNTNTTVNTASADGNGSRPLVLSAATAKSTTTTTATTKTSSKSSNSNANNNSKVCDNLAAQQLQVQNDLAHDNDVLGTVRNDRVRYEGYVRDDNETLISDHQAVDQDQRDLDTAKTNLAAGVISDQKTILDAQTQLTQSLDTQRTGDLSDQQAVASAQNDVNTAQSQVAQQVASKAANEIRPQNSAEVASAQQDAVDKLQGVADAQKALDDTTLLSPADGTVAVIGGRLGEDVPGGGSNRGGFDASALSRPPNAQAPGSVSSRAGGFITLTDLGTNEVKARFSEADTAKIEPGQAAKVEFESLGQTLSARVVRIDAIETVVANVVTYTVTLLLDKKLDAIKPGMTGNVDVIISQKQNVLRLPVTAINPRNGRATVQVLGKDGKTETRDVTTGLKGDDDIEITSGLDVGDKVVVATGGAGKQTQG